MAKWTETQGMTFAKKYLAPLSLLAIGVLIGRSTAPARVEIKEVAKVEYVDRVEIRTVKIKDTTQKKAKTIVRETERVTKPGGEVVERTKTTVGEVTQTETKTAEAKESAKETNLKSTIEKSTVVESQPRYLVGITLSTNQAYGAFVGYRLLGPVWVTGTLDTKGNAAVGAGVSF